MNMNYVIKFCENNFVHGTDKIAAKLEEDGYNVIVMSCLKNCSDCQAMPYAVVKDDIIYADSADYLYDKIRAVIN